MDDISLFSHELKTPLSSLKIGLSLLEKDFEKYKHLLYLMKEEVEKMTDFITDNLDLRSIQKKKDLFQWKWSTFEPSLNQACRSLQLIAQKENISFHIKKTAEPVELFMDSSWMVRLLVNLLSNAIQFSPSKGTVFIEYGLRGQVFVCSVRDEGQGIADKKRLFDYFYKTAVEEKKGIKNTGLGLSIARAITIAHGGKLTAFSNPRAKGATFKLLLPRIRRLKRAG